MSPKPRLMRGVVACKNDDRHRFHAIFMEEEFIEENGEWSGTILEIECVFDGEKDPIHKDAIGMTLNGLKCPECGGDLHNNTTCAMYPVD